MNFGYTCFSRMCAPQRSSRILGLVLITVSFKEQKSLILITFGLAFFKAHTFGVESKNSA